MKQNVRTIIVRTLIGEPMSNQPYPFAYFNGNTVPLEQANISIASNSLQYGTTCFGGIRGYAGQGTVKIFRPHDHHERLMAASKMLGMKFYQPYDEFEQIIRELIHKNKPTSDFYLRPFIFSSTPQLAPKPNGLKFELGVYCVPLAHYFNPDKGMRLMVSSWRKFSDSAMPTKAKAGGCYVNSFLASGEAQRHGYDEALLMDHEGYIVEASVANVLMVHRGRLLMPNVGSSQLEGLTMRTAIEFLKEEGHTVHFEKIDRSMLYSCEELILMGTAAQFSFAESVDDRFIGSHDPYHKHPGPGAICQLLRRKFKTVIDGTHRKSTEWMMEFSP